MPRSGFSSKVLGFTSSGVPFSATGGTITDSGGYRYHTFNSSGSFVVSSGSKTVEILAVGGGGAGGTTAYWGKTGQWYGAGGAGAGCYESKSVTTGTGSYPVLVGAGAVSGGTNGSPYNGNPSYISNLGGTTTYTIGSTGPAGGKIFWLPNGTTGTGTVITNQTGMYFEMAPVGAEVSRTFAETAYQSTRVSTTSDERGYGYHNTNSIIAQGNSNPATCAAKYCADYTLNGFSDWFLPSITELQIITNYYGSTNKTAAGISSLTGFAGYYWSSSSGTTTAYGSNGIGNSSGSQAKSNSFLVRPVRAFSTVGEVLAFGAGGMGGAHGDQGTMGGGMSMFFGGNVLTNANYGKIGGGGGAGGVGLDGTTSPYYEAVTAGGGGAGTTWNSFKSFGGGGGGGGGDNWSIADTTPGAGGSFGGGAGGTFVSGVPNSGTAGTANTGGGGGGAAYDSGLMVGGASGGSGVVIVRYPL